MATILKCLYAALVRPHLESSVGPHHNCGTWYEIKQQQAKFKAERIRLDIRKKISTMRTVQHWIGLPKEDDQTYLEVFQAWLDKALKNLDKALTNLMWCHHLIWQSENAVFCIPFQPQLSYHSYHSTCTAVAQRLLI